MTIGELRKELEKFNSETEVKIYVNKQLDRDTVGIKNFTYAITDKRILIIPEHDVSITEDVQLRNLINKIEDDCNCKTCEDCLIKRYCNLDK